MFLPILGRFWPYIAIGLLSLSLWGALKYGAHQRHLADVATEIANDNFDIAQRERLERQRVDGILAGKTKADLSRHQRLNQQKAEVAHATKEMDGPIAPVLRGALNSLPEPPKAATPNEG